ncbi:MAG TPA: hypothetical protein VGO68_06135 [Pyrinomonadaceae bacterium]|jgi:hypothetical protein|nr:hypothetical protein [Pyrinomonadaceae bacterium]
MKHQRTPLTIIVAASILASLPGCKTAQNPPQSSTVQATPSPIINATLDVDQIVKAFKAAAIPIQNEVIYTAENDTNKLLGRPHQYIGKANWNDVRAPALIKGDQDMTVEVFASAEDMENRRSYVESIQKKISPLAQYHFTHKNALLRLNHKLTPAQAAEYEKVLKAL